MFVQLFNRLYFNNKPFYLPLQPLSTVPTLIPVFLCVFNSVFTPPFSLSFPSVSVFLLFSLSSAQYRESVLCLRPQLLPDPPGSQCQQRPGTGLHQERLRAFHLFTLRQLAFLFLLPCSSSASPFLKSRPLSRAV